MMSAGPKFLQRAFRKEGGPVWCHGIDPLHKAIGQRDVHAHGFGGQDRRNHHEGSTVKIHTRNINRRGRRFAIGNQIVNHFLQDRRRIGQRGFCGGTAGINIRAGDKRPVQPIRIGGVQDGGVKCALHWLSPLAQLDFGLFFDSAHNAFSDIALAADGRNGPQGAAAPGPGFKQALLRGFAPQL